MSEGSITPDLERLARQACEADIDEARAAAERFAQDRG
jgi:hypothetical protein